MRGYIFRKILVVLIFIIPAVSYTGCKKQARCGCDKDILFSLDNESIDYSTLVFNAEGTTGYFQLGYDTYYLCNPVESYEIYKTFTAGDQMLMSGDAFWECNYLYNSSNYSYASYYKVYTLHVTDLKVYLYGKK
jgi:hypothetical protein